MNFAALDLNLLRVFDAMAIELNTTRAGERVGLSQPAVSSALGRLRHIVGDELFVREGNRMVATPRALMLREPIRAALRQMENALSSVARFEPAAASQTFRISGSDYFSALLMPRLAAAVIPEAPGVTLQMLDHPSSEALRLLGEGAIDMGVDARFDLPEWVCSQTLFQSFIVSVARKDHPILAKAGIQPGCAHPARRLLRDSAGSDVDGRRQDGYGGPGARRPRTEAPGGRHRAAFPSGGADRRRGRFARQPADPLRASGRARCSTSIFICRPSIRRSST